jgi:hypothetical protein
VGWLISGVAVVTRTPQLFKIIRAESVRGIEPSLYEVRSCALPPRGWHCTVAVPVAVAALGELDWGDSLCLTS